MYDDTGPPLLGGTLASLCTAALRALADEAASLRRVTATPGADPDDLWREIYVTLAARWATRPGLVVMAHDLATLPSSATDHAVAWALDENNPDMIALGRAYATRFDPSVKMKGQSLV